MDLIEIIIRYYGNVIDEISALDGETEILSESYAIVTIPQKNVEALSALPNVIYIEYPKKLALNYNISAQQSGERYTGNVYGLSGKDVIVGIIDSGIDYKNNEFITADNKSRIIYIWDQSVDGNPPQGFNMGYEYTNEDINNAIESGININHTDFEGHGTAVAGICAGKNGVAYESSIIMVKLGEKGREYFGRTTELMRAIKYIYDKAERLNMPAAINISFGTNDGSHDGNALFEQYIDEMSLRKESSIVVASGNEGASGHHYSNIIKNNDKVTVEFTVSSNLREVFLTGWKNYTDEMNFELITPDNVSTGVISYSSRQVSTKLGQTDVLFSVGRPSPYNISQEIYINLISPQSGIWRLIIYGVNIIEGSINIWLPVTEAVSNNTTFLAPCIETTATLPSTAFNVITVGGYNPVNKSIAVFSGRGFTRQYNFVKPDIVAPAINIISAKVNGGTGVYTGTSFAAPFVTGTAALLMQWGIIEKNDIFMYGQKLKSVLRSGAERKPNLTYPNKEWGFGSLDINNTIGQLISQGTVSIQQESSLKDAIFSEEYLDATIIFNEQVRKILENYPQIKYFTFFNDLYAVLFIPKREYAYLFENKGKSILNTDLKILGLMDTIDLQKSGITDTRNNLSLRGNGVLIGILDTGIDYKNREFLFEDNTTKIAYMWDQTDKNGTPPEGQYYGREYTSEEINAALASGEELGITDDLGHGTFLAAISGGRVSGAAPDAEFVIVKLKPAKQNMKESNYIFTDAPAYESSDVMTAMDYLYTISQKTEKPISICVGLGTNSGSHSGTSLLETYMGLIAVRNGIIVTVATGNEGDKGHHARDEIENDIPKKLEISVGDGEKGFITDIWIYTPDKIKLSIVSPLAEEIRSIQFLSNFNQIFQLPLSGTEITITYFSSFSAGELELYQIKFLNPVSGIWQINITGEDVYSGFYNAWLPITQFLSAETKFLVSDSFYTLTLPSSGIDVIAIGGYNSSNNSIYSATGRGPSTLERREPLFVAPAVNVAATGIMTGTSVAAAITCGAYALLLEWAVVKGNNPIINTDTAAIFMVRGTGKVNNVDLPNNIWGFGTLDLYNSFRKLI